MKRFYFRFRILLLTLALGLSSVNFVNWLADYLSEISVDLPTTESESPIFVLPREWKDTPDGGDSGGSGCYGCVKSSRKAKHTVKLKKYLL